MARTSHPSILKRQKEQTRLARAEEKRAAKRAKRDRAAAALEAETEGDSGTPEPIPGEEAGNAGD